MTGIFSIFSPRTSLTQAKDESHSLKTGKEVADASLSFKTVRAVSADPAALAEVRDAATGMEFKKPARFAPGVAQLVAMFEKGGEKLTQGVGANTAIDKAPAAIEVQSGRGVPTAASRAVSADTAAPAEVRGAESDFEYVENQLYASYAPVVEEPNAMFGKGGEKLTQGVGTNTAIDEAPAEIEVQSERGMPETASPVAACSNSIRAVNALSELRLQAAINALSAIEARAESGASKRIGRNNEQGESGALKNLKWQLEELQTTESQSKSQPDREASAKEIKAAKHLYSNIVATLGNEARRILGIKPKEAVKIGKAEFSDAVSKLLSGKAWNPVRTSFEVNRKAYACNLIPAAHMKLPGASADIFPVSYEGKGVSCDSKKEVRHVTNLWTSEIRAKGEDGKEGEVIFKGVRHGILSPFGLEKGSPEREAGAIARAREVVTAALYSQEGLMKDALAGNTVTLKLASTSLVTGGIRKKEASMLEDQMAAWKALAKSQPVQLMVVNEAGKQVPVKVKLEVAAFNFGVNELALKGPGMGNNHGDLFNKPALQQLIGDLRRGEPIGGWAMEFILNNPEKAKNVSILCEQLREIWEKKAHHRDGGEPYKAARRVALLAYEIGAVPAWNCMSGKDRTGMLDAELKFEAVRLHQGKDPAKIGMIPDDEKASFHTVSMNSGNLEVQAYNTGVQGNKSMRDLPFLNLTTRLRFGATEVWKHMQGLAKLIKS